MSTRNFQRALRSDLQSPGLFVHAVDIGDNIASLYEIALKTEQVCADIPKAVQDRKKRINLRNFRKMAQLMRKKGFDDSFIAVKCAPFIMG